MLDDFSVSIVLNTESMIQDTSDVVVPEGGDEKIAFSFNVPTVLVCLCTYSLGLVFFKAIRKSRVER